LSKKEQRKLRKALARAKAARDARGGGGGDEEQRRGGAEDGDDDDALLQDMGALTI